jgi:hypothetical protein
VKVAVGAVTVMRFPDDQSPIPAVAKVVAIRGEQALVRKRSRGGMSRWAKPRWSPLANVARLATDREERAGYPIDPVPHNMATSKQEARHESTFREAG